MTNVRKFILVLAAGLMAIGASVHAVSAQDELAFVAPCFDPSPGTWVALAGTAVAIMVTATVAAPLHGRLDTRDPALLARLLAADRVRCVSACLALAGALGAALA